MSRINWFLTTRFLMNRHRQRRTREAFTSVEVTVASTLLVVIMSTIGPLAIRTTRIWQDSRHQQLALEELTGQIERLIALSPSDRTEAMQTLTPSQALATAAPNAEIIGQTLQNSESTRIVLKLRWNQPNYPRADLTLVGWVDPLPQGETP